MAKDNKTLLKLLVRLLKRFEAANVDSTAGV